MTKKLYRNGSTVWCHFKHASTDWNFPVKHAVERYGDMGEIRCYEVVGYAADEGRDVRIEFDVATFEPYKDDIVILR